MTRDPSPDPCSAGRVATASTYPAAKDRSPTTRSRGTTEAWATTSRRSRSIACTPPKAWSASSTEKSSKAACHSACSERTVGSSRSPLSATTSLNGASSQVGAGGEPVPGAADLLQEAAHLRVHDAEAEVGVDLVVDRERPRGGDVAREVDELRHPGPR